MKYLALLACLLPSICFPQTTRITTCGDTGVFIVIYEGLVYTVPPNDIFAHPQNSDKTFYEIMKNDLVNGNFGEYQTDAYSKHLICGKTA